MQEINVNSKRDIVSAFLDANNANIFSIKCTFVQKVLNMDACAAVVWTISNIANIFWDPLDSDSNCSIKESINIREGSWHRLSYSHPRGPLNTQDELPVATFQLAVFTFQSHSIFSKKERLSGFRHHWFSNAKIVFNNSNTSCKMLSENLSS